MGSRCAGLQTLRASVLVCHACRTRTWRARPALPRGGADGDEAHHEVLVLLRRRRHRIRVGALRQRALAAHLCGRILEGKGEFFTQASP